MCAPCTVFGALQGRRWSSIDAPVHTSGVVTIRWTGAGILAYLLVFIAPFMAWVLGLPDDPVELLVEVGVLYLVTGGIVVGLGVWLNSTRQPGGRVWTDAHTVDGYPMQRPTVGFAGTLATLAFAVPPVWRHGRRRRSS